MTQYMKTMHSLSIGAFCLVIQHVAAASAINEETEFFACTDYHCDTGETVALTEDDWKLIRDLFPVGLSPEEERERIGRAVASLETSVGAITGTWRDLAGNVNGSGRGGQLDCISESKNTTTYLKLLSDDGLLIWHSVGNRHVRRRFFAPHWTAVIIDRMSGERFSVDSWYFDNGEPPVIQPLEDWFKGVEVISK